jgi:predicted Zn-dependent protease
MAPGFLLSLLLTGCADLNFYTEAEEAKLGVAAYAQIVSAYTPVTSGSDYEMLQRVGDRIARASGKDYEWEFKLLPDPTPNAFCLPGGKVAVYSGILAITANEDGLAAVVGHEVAHATLRHGGKRMTRSTLVQLGLSAAGIGLSYSEMDRESQHAVLAALGAGAQVGLMLPYSRDHESEADELGLRYSVRAGYDPHEAVALWRRMEGTGNQGPEWLSTHPHPRRRADELEELIPRLIREERGDQAPSLQR